MFDEPVQQSNLHMHRLAKEVQGPDQFRFRDQAPKDPSQDFQVHQVYLHGGWEQFPQVDYSFADC
jgi:hypothetical protein